jgi:hypothetical protein
MRVFWSIAALVGGVALFGGAATGRVAAGDDAGKALKVHFARTLGVGDFTGFPDLTSSDKDLSAGQERRLRQLLADAGFFELTSSPPPPPYVPDPPAGYDLRVEMDGRTHSIWVQDGDVGDALKPLIEWLADRAKEESVKVRFTKSGGIAGLLWSAELDSASLSAEDARELRKRIADAHFFGLPEKPGETHGADLFAYTVTAEMGGKRHTVQVSDDTAPESLRPLLDWLSERAELQRPCGR